MPQPRRPITYMPDSGQQRYVITKKTLDKLTQYQADLCNRKVQPGNELLEQINHFLAAGKDEYEPDKPLTDSDLERLKKLHPSEFMQLLMDSRKPKIFAESEATVGSGEMWNNEEYEILGGVASVINGVDTYDNGKYGSSGMGDGRYKENPHKVNILCIPGAILRPPHTIDRNKILDGNGGGIDPDKFKQFYKERLLAVFQEANDTAKKNGKKAFITVPGIGNGVFAGEFAGTTIGLLKDTLKELLEENSQWQNIGCVHLDGFKSTVCEDVEIEGSNALLRVRNTGGGGKNNDHKLHSGKPYSDLGQMSKAEDFAESEEEAKEFAGHERFKLFAWDHFSYEGNDWVGGSRATDEANMAACNALGIMSGGKGEYRNGGGKVESYYPPEGYSTWKQFFIENNMKQSIADRLFVLDNGNFYQLGTDNVLKNALFNQKKSELSWLEKTDPDEKIRINLTEQIACAAFDSQKEPHAGYIGILLRSIPPRLRESIAKEMQDGLDKPETSKIDLRGLQDDLIERVNSSGIVDKESAIQRIQDCFTAIGKQAQKVIDGDYLQINSSYAHGKNEKSRGHDNPASYSGSNERFQGKTGDVLKREILEDFKEQLAECTTKEELKAVVTMIQKSNEYKILATPQDLFSELTGRKTSSVRAFNELVVDAVVQINKQQLNPATNERHDEKFKMMKDGLQKTKSSEKLDDQPDPSYVFRS